MQCLLCSGLYCLETNHSYGEQPSGRLKGACVSYYFDMAVVCSNAFFAVQSERSYLSEFELDQFCGILQREVEATLASGEGQDCCRVIFDFSDDDSRLSSMGFVKTDGYVVYYGDPISQGELDVTNYCLGFGPVQGAFDRARACFPEAIRSSANTRDSQFQVA